jgi:hypothetical protein
LNKDRADRPAVNDELQSKIGALTGKTRRGTIAVQTAEFNAPNEFVNTETISFIDSTERYSNLHSEDIH